MTRDLLIIVSLLGFWSDSFALARGADTIRDAVVKIETTQQRPDYYSPWRKSNSSKSGGSGVIIDVNGLHVLTNAHVVSFASQIYVQPNQSADKFSASVVAIAPGIDLALLKLEDSEVLAKHSSLQLAENLPKTKDTVNVYGFPIGGEDLSVTEGIISRIEYKRFYFDESGVRIQVDAALNPGNSGGPAVSDDQIVGLVFSGIKDAENIGYLIPAHEIRTFLQDIEDGSYQGKPHLFEMFQTAENDALRERLGIEKETTGLVVSQPYLDEESYPLKKWDLVTHIGTHAIDNLGLVQVRDDLRLRFSHFIPQAVQDDHVELTIVRDNQEQKVSMPVVYQRNRLLPTLKYDYPEYAILGPLVFTTATHELVRSISSSYKWSAYLSEQENPLVGSMSKRRSFADEELVTVCSRMFSHPIRKGYGSPAFGVLTQVNEQTVKNLTHFIELIRDGSDEYVELTFAGRSESMVFRRDELIESNETILETEGIRHQFSPRLRKIWAANNN